MSFDILLVDDDRDVLDALEARFALAGLKTLCCASFIEAKDHILPHLNACIVTDIQMPGKSGFDLIAHAQTVDPELPIIVLTGYADTPVVVKAMRGGAVTVLDKPCPMETLLDQISEARSRREAVLKNRQLRARRAAQGRPPQDRALSPQLAEYEAELIRRALKRHQGNKVKAAQDLGISRSQLYAKLKDRG